VIDLTSLLMAFVRVVWPPHTGTRVRSRRMPPIAEARHRTMARNRRAPEPTVTEPRHHAQDWPTRPGPYPALPRFADRTEPLPRTPMVDAPWIDPCTDVVPGYYRGHERWMLAGADR
jgi:hypothetical protein